VKIIETTWDDSLREGGRVLAIETDKAFQAIAKDSDWAFYIQGDEVVHEKYLETIQSAMVRWKDDKNVDGLLFNYIHFYGSYNYIGSSARWYQNEIRVIKNNKNIYSYCDAQGFRKGNNEKLRVKAIDAYVYHYGWVKPPAIMQKKREEFHKLWHSDKWIETNVAGVEAFDYSNIDMLEHFKETHPAVMLERIKNKNWTFDYDLTWNRNSLKDRFKKFIKKYIGVSIGYKNYIKV
jgi:hypothetical protein